MKKILFLALVICNPLPAVAGSCVALDYEEMKEMTVEDLRKEMCKALTSEVENVVAIIEMELSSTSLLYNTLEKMADDCSSQRDRIVRVLVQKGVEVTQTQEACTALFPPAPN